MMTFPQIDPVALQLGPLAIRWYALAYLAGIVLGWFYVRRLNERLPVKNLTRDGIDDLMLYAVLGIVLGGRIGYVCFYKPLYYLSQPLDALKVWEGGMSFHGGLIGVIVAFALFCRKYKTPYLPLMDMIACAAPIGLFFGRVANFINGELFGRVTESRFGMVFPHGGELPRHPSQLYEAGLEGLALGLILFLCARFTRLRETPGRIAGLFLIGYSLARMISEQFREPDAHLGLLFAGTTMGQLLSAPMMILGLWLLFRSTRHDAHRPA